MGALQSCVAARRVIDTLKKPRANRLFTILPGATQGSPQALTGEDKSSRSSATQAGFPRKCSTLAHTSFTDVALALPPTAPDFPKLESRQPPFHRLPMALGSLLH